MAGHLPMRSVGLWFVVTGLCLAWGQVSPLRGQPAVAGHVLDLDGKSGYVELPPDIFKGVEEGTVEAWVRWRSFPTNGWSRFFSYGAEIP